LTAPATRIRAFDWLRGLAVLFMIQCHALSLLTPELRASNWALRLLWLDGLVAPSFIFAAGFSLALVQVRGAAAGTRGKRAVKTLRRLGEVFFVATLVNWMWFPLFRHPSWFLRVDILHCIALALIIALPLMMLLAPRPAVLRWVSLGLAVVTFAVSPFGQLVHGPWGMLANQNPAWVQDGEKVFAVFPLLPWAGYVYLGASAGATAAMGDLSRVVRWVAGLGVLGLVLWKGAPLLAGIYPPDGAWLPGNHGNRILILCTLVLVLLGLEYPAAGRWQKSLPVRLVEVFGQSSMAGYFFHEMLLYYEWFGFSFHRWWGDKSSWGRYWVLTAALIASTTVLVLLMDRVYAVYDRAVRRAMGDAPPRPPAAAVLGAPGSA
jgi:uncharacterized membrane protein